MAQAAAAGQRTSFRQVSVATLVGGVIEWYDFALYGLIAALVFNKLLFPSVDPTPGTYAQIGIWAPAALVMMGLFRTRIEEDVPAAEVPAPAGAAVLGRSGAE